MAQHHRTINSYTPNFNQNIEMDVHLCSVSDTLTIEGQVHPDDAMKVAAAIVEMYRYHGHSTKRLLKQIRKQIKKWDDNEDHS